MKNNMSPTRTKDNEHKNRNESFESYVCEDKVLIIIIIKQAIAVNNAVSVLLSISISVPMQVPVPIAIPLQLAIRFLVAVSLTFSKSYWQDNVAALPMMTASGTNIFRSFSP